MPIMTHMQSRERRKNDREDASEEDRGNLFLRGANGNAPRQQSLKTEKGVGNEGVGKVISSRFFFSASISRPA